MSQPIEPTVPSPLGVTKRRNGKLGNQKWEMEYFFIVHIHRISGIASK